MMTKRKRETARQPKRRAQTQAAQTKTMNNNTYKQDTNMNRYRHTRFIVLKTRKNNNSTKSKVTPVAYDNYKKVPVALER